MDILPDDFLRALGDETRLRCLLLLHEEAELCVCELTHALGVIQPKVSRHLASLREAGVVADRRQGQWVYYRLAPDLPDWTRDALAAVARGARGRTPYADDNAALSNMPNRPGAACCA
jgi:ArsR family transcriptional regulator